MRIKVVLRVSDRTPRAGQRVRFFGTAAPQHDGLTVRIQRQTPTGAWKTVARARLQDAGDERSKFGHRLRVRRDGIYRARVASDPDAAGTSTSLEVRRRALAGAVGVPRRLLYDFLQSEGVFLRAAWGITAVGNGLGTWEGLSVARKSQPRHAPATHVQSRTWTRAAK